METITKWRAFEWHIIKWVTFIEMPGRLARVTNQAKNVGWKMAAHCRQCAGVHKQLPGDGAEYHRVLGPTTRTLPACIWSEEYKLWLNIEILLRSLCLPVRKITNYFRLHALSRFDKLLIQYCLRCRSFQNFDRCAQKNIYQFPFSISNRKQNCFIFLSDLLECLK